MRKLPLGTLIRINEGVMDILEIPKIELIDNHEELWTYVILDRNKEFNKKRKYIVSTYGRVYNVEDRHMMNPYNSWTNSKGEPYKSIGLMYDCEKHSYLIHRLVALAFIPKDKNRDFVNHIDGHPSHPYVWNLEWATLSENVIHAIRTGLKKDKLGELRPNAKWTDDEVRIICQMMAEGHKATYIYHALGDILQDPKVQYERVRSLYKHIIHKTHWTHISKDYDIDFTPYNYSKEIGSVKKKSMKN